MPYLLSDSDHGKLQRMLSEVARQSVNKLTATRRRRTNHGASSSPARTTFQLIKGVVSAVHSLIADYETYHYCELSESEYDNGVIAFEESAKAPTEIPVYVAFPDTDIPVVGDTIWAAYHAAIVTVPAQSDYDPAIVIDWYKLPTGDKDTKIVLIEADITGVVEDEAAEIVTDYCDVVNLWAYTRVVLSLKYYRTTTPDDGEYVDGANKMILQTELDDYGCPVPSVTDVFYDDGKSFIVGEYIKEDYPDYPEDEIFPPDGTGTYETPTTDYLNKRYRGIATNGVLHTILCDPLPAPPFIVAGS